MKLKPASYGFGMWYKAAGVGAKMNLESNATPQTV